MAAMCKAFERMQVVPVYFYWHQENSVLLAFIFFTCRFQIVYILPPSETCQTQTAVSAETSEVQKSTVSSAACTQC